jgi:SEC-C motif-containing protein
MTIQNITTQNRTTQQVDCLCGKPKPFARCCGRLLRGEDHARTPEQLMRSRYCAYALGGYGEYLLQTWFPATAQGLDAVSLSQPSVQWCKLEVLDKLQQGENAEVEFRAWYRPPGQHEGEPVSMHERSSFNRIKGRWYYVGGRVS